MAKNLLFFLAGVGAATIGCSAHFMNHLNTQSKKIYTQLELTRKALIQFQMPRIIGSTTNPSLVQKSITPTAIKEEVKNPVISIKTDLKDDEKIKIEFKNNPDETNSQQSSIQQDTYKNKDNTKEQTNNSQPEDAKVDTISIEVVKEPSKSTVSNKNS